MLKSEGQKEQKPKAPPRREVNSSLLSQTEHKDSEGKVKRRTVRLSKEGKENAKKSWTNIIASISKEDGNPVSFPDIKKRINQEIISFAEQRNLVQDIDEKDYLRLLEGSFKKRLEHQQRVEIASQLGASNSPWESSRTKMKDTFYPGKRGVFAQGYIDEHILKVKETVGGAVDKCIGEGVLKDEDRLRYVVCYDQYLSRKIEDFIESQKSRGNILAVQNEGLQNLVSQSLGLGDRELSDFLYGEIKAGITEKTSQAQQSPVQVPQIETVQAEELSPRQIISDTEARTSGLLILQKLNAAGEKMRQTPGRILEALRPTPTSLKRAVLTGTLVGVLSVGGGGLINNLQILQEFMKKPVPIALIQEKPALSAAVDTAIKAPNPEPSILRDQVETVVTQNQEPIVTQKPEVKKPESIRANLLADNLTAYQPGTNNLIKADFTDADRNGLQVMDVKQNATGDYRVLLKTSGGKMLESPLNQVLIEGLNIESERVGVRVGTPETVDWATEVGTKNVRIAGNSARVTEGSFVDKDLEQTMLTAEKESRDVLFVFNPNTLPPYDSLERKEAVTLEGIKKDENLIKSAIRERLEVILRHKNVKYIEVGNEVNLSSFWLEQNKSTLESFKAYAYFLKWSSEIIREIRPDVGIIVSSIASPLEGSGVPVLFTILKQSGVNMGGMYAGVHQYEEDVDKAIELTRKESGLRPIVTEMGVDVKGKESANKLKELLNVALQKTDGPVFVHELNPLGEDLVDVGTGVHFSIGRGDPRFVAIRQAVIDNSIKPIQTVLAAVRTRLASIRAATTSA